MTQDQYVAAPMKRPAIPVQGSDKLFPIHRIFCLGRNYRAHIKEMGGDAGQSTPIYFTKSPSAYFPSGGEIPYPPGTEDFHYEMELVVAIGASGHRLSLEDAGNVIYGYACGLDMTRRDLQIAAKARRSSWALAKDIENGAVISPIAPATRTGPVSHGRIHLALNGQVRQDSLLQNMIWSVPETLCHLSRYYHLQPGDILFTGTPEGVGPAHPGDQLTGAIEHVGDITLAIGPGAP